MDITEKPHLTIQPPKGWVPLNLMEVWKYRDLLGAMTGRDVKVRYKQTILGPTWVVLQPLMGAGIFTFVFGTIAGLDPGGGIPPFVFMLTSMLCWNFASSVLSKTSDSLVGNAGMLQKVYFPRLILPFASVFSSMIDFIVGMGMLIVLLVMYGIFPGVQVLLAPVFLGLLVMLALGVGMVSSAYVVSYRDVKYVVPVLTQFLLYASPVPYTLANMGDRVSEQWQAVYMLNPVVSLIEGYRWALLGLEAPPVGYLIYSVVCAFGALLMGAFTFKRMERKFADVV